MNATLIIDADDTLWENNIYYEEAIDRFLDITTLRRLSRDMARQRLMEVERRNIHLYGYGSLSFRHSLRETLESLTGTPAETEELQTLEELTNGIANMAIRFLPGVKPTLVRLRERFRLILFTKGDPAEQQRKIDRSGVTSLFDHIELTTEKDLGAYTRLLRRYRLDPSKTWMVGNSPRSDINPALQAGMNAILIPHPRTWTLEHDEVRQDGGDRFRRLERFEDLLDYFQL